MGSNGNPTEVVLPSDDLPTVNVCDDLPTVNVCDDVPTVNVCDDLPTVNVCEDNPSRERPSFSVVLNLLCSKNNLFLLIFLLYLEFRKFLFRHQAQ